MEGGSRLCSICLEPIQGEDGAPFLLPCGHAHHDECLAIWFTKDRSCPVCRTPAFPPPPPSSPPPPPDSPPPHPPPSHSQRLFTLFYAVSTLCLLLLHVLEADDLGAVVSFLSGMGEYSPPIAIFATMFILSRVTASSLSSEEGIIFAAVGAVQASFTTAASVRMIVH